MACLVFVETGVAWADESFPTEENGLGAPHHSALQPSPGQELKSRQYPLEVIMDAAWFSRYIWHGLDFSNQKPVLQPEVIVSLSKISAIFWFNYDFQTFNAVNEYDMTLQYTDTLGPVGIKFGYSSFTYPHRGWPDSKEVWIQGSYNGGLNPVLNIHDDFGSENGWYSSLGISHDFDLPIGTLAPSALLHYHAHCYGGTGFPSAEFDLADAVSIGKATASITFSYYRALKDGDFSDLEDQIVYGFKFAWSLP